MILSTPLRDEDVEKLHAGNRVSITGVIYTARDRAHKRLAEAIQEKEELPFHLEGGIIYYCGPSPAPPGKVIGSAGPTTASRMDPFTIPLLGRGLKGMVGKGRRNPEVLDALRKYKAVYLVAIGGAGAFLSEKIRKAEIIAYADLGPEAIHRLEVEDFPAIVANDCHGGNIFTKEGG